MRLGGFVFAEAIERPLNAFLKALAKAEQTGTTRGFGDRHRADTARQVRAPSQALMISTGGPKNVHRLDSSGSIGGPMLISLLLVLAADPKVHVSLVKYTATASASAVQKELKAQLEPLEGCYDLALRANPTLHGSVTVLFSVEEEVGVTTINASEDSVKDETLVSCVLARLRFGEWPRPKKPLAITATFRFEQK